MPRALKIAVVGAGMAGQAHAHGYRNATMLPALSDVQLELAAIVDANAELARSVAARYGFATSHTELDAVLSDGSIDAVSLALPNILHAEAVPRAFAAGKHVLAEKPLGRSASEALSFARAADESGKVHAISFTWRRLAAVEAMAQVVGEGRLGDLWHAHAWYLTDYASTEATPWSWRYDRQQAGGGASLDVGAHLLAAFEHVAGPIERVLAADAHVVIPTRRLPASAVVGHGQVALSDEARDVTTDDVTTVLARLQGGAPLTVLISRVAAGVPNSMGFQLTGSKGSLSYDSQWPDEYQLYTRDLEAAERNGPRRIVVGAEQPAFANPLPMPAKGVASGYGSTFVRQAQDFLQAILDGRPASPNLWDGYRTMLVCDAMQRAAERGAPVVLSELDAELRGSG
jgi:predicted dehydrogenase